VSADYILTIIFIVNIKTGDGLAPLVAAAALPASSQRKDKAMMLILSILALIAGAVRVARRSAPAAIDHANGEEAVP
jgi:hypothetical protein